MSFTDWGKIESVPFMFKNQEIALENILYNINNVIFYSLCIVIRGNSDINYINMNKKTNSISQTCVNFLSLEFHNREPSLRKTFLM